PADAGAGRDEHVPDARAAGARIVRARPGGVAARHRRRRGRGVPDRARRPGPVAERGTRGRAHLSGPALRRRSPALRPCRLGRTAGAELMTYGHLAPDRVPDAINAANAVIATSEREGFGLAPLEALACDVPVLSTDVGIAPFALRGVEGTLCAPFDVERWRKALDPHLDDPDPRVPGRARAALFDRDRMAARVLAAYGDLTRAS